MKLNKYIYFFLSLLLTGCLEVEILDRVEKETTFFKNEEHAQTALNGTYACLTDFMYHKANWPLILSTYEDAMFSTGTAVPATVSNNTHSSNSAPCTNFWVRIYQGVNNANEIIARVPGIEFADENNKNRILAEAHFLRGLFHYDLQRLYGFHNGIPVITQPATGLGNAYNAQQPKDSVYAQILRDFTYAAGYNEDGTTRLPKKTDAGYIAGRVTNGAAHAFLAEVNLTLGNWAKAIEHANEVISSNAYSLVQDYSKLWDINTENEAQKEHIFSIAFFADADATADASLGTGISHTYNPNAVAVGGGFLCGNPYGKGGGVHRVQKWFIQFFQDDKDNLGYSDPTKDASIDESNLIYKDYRIEISFWRKFQAKNNNTGVLGDITACYPAGQSSEVAKVENWGYIKKYIDPKGLHNRTNGNDVTRLRLSDMYLIKAEALNELGEYEDACAAIDKVRERARKANGVEREWPKYISSTQTDNIGRTLSKDEFRWLVFMERGLEFVGEQKRWFDLIRMKYDENTLMYDYMWKTYIPKQPAATVQKQGVMAERKKAFPIPFNEISRNSGIVQNDGY